MQKLPCGDFGANALFFSIGILTVNLFVAQRLFVMPEDWRTKSIRWLPVEVARKIIRGGRCSNLKITASLDKYRLYLEMRRRTYELLLE
jgi:hypothetical protein